MNSDFLPQHTTTRTKANIGVNRASTIFNDEFGWIFRRVSQEDDVGIDAFVDIVNDDRRATGQSIAMQIKHGSSYFSQQTRNHIVFKGENKHINLYHNTSIPVIIVLSHPDGSMYWELFDKDCIEKAGEGWKLYIPKKNLLTKSKSKLLTIVPDFEDISEDTCRLWRENDELRGSSVIFYHIDQDELNSRDVEPFLAFVDRISCNPMMLEEASCKLNLFTSIYDKDDREVWEIKAFRNWIKKLDKKGFAWFYYCHRHEYYSILRIYYMIMCDAQRTGSRPPGPVVNGSTIVTARLDNAKYRDLVSTNFDRLNTICDELGMTDGEVWGLSQSALQAIGFVIDSDGRVDFYNTENLPFALRVDPPV